MARAYDANTRDRLLLMVADLYLKGWGYRMIAEHAAKELQHAVTFQTVGNYVRALMEEWKAGRLDKIDEQKCQELAKIDKLEFTYWQAWERSLKGAETKTRKQKAIKIIKKGKDGKTGDTMDPYQAEQINKTEETYGDPRFLQGIQWCIQMRCKILGIAAPEEGGMTVNLPNVIRKVVFKVGPTPTKKS